MADRRDFEQVWSDMTTAGIQDLESFRDGGPRVRQKLVGIGQGIGLITRVDDDLARPREMLDPRAIDCGVDLEPSMKKHDDRSTRRFRFGGLEDPERSIPVTIFLADKTLMRIYLRPRGRIRAMAE